MLCIVLTYVSLPAGIMIWIAGSSLMKRLVAQYGGRIYPTVYIPELMMMKNFQIHDFAKSITCQLWSGDSGASRLTLSMVSGSDRQCQHLQAGNAAVESGDQTLPAGQRNSDGAVAGQQKKHSFTKNHIQSTSTCLCPKLNPHPCMYYILCGAH